MPLDPVTYSRLAVLATASLPVAYFDLGRRTIPPLLSGGCAAAGLAVNSLLYGLPGFLNSLYGALAAGALLAFLWGCGLIGGGDVKWFAAVSATLSVENVLFALKLTGLAGGALAAVYWLLGRRGRGLPYGVAISMGAIATVLMG